MSHAAGKLLQSAFGVVSMDPNKFKKFEDYVKKLVNKETSQFYPWVINEVEQKYKNAAGEGNSGKGLLYLWKSLKNTTQLVNLYVSELKDFDFYNFTLALMRNESITGLMIKNQSRDTMTITGKNLIYLLGEKKNQYKLLSLGCLSYFKKDELDKICTVLGTYTNLHTLELKRGIEGKIGKHKYEEGSYPPLEDGDINTVETSKLLRSDTLKKLDIDFGITGVLEGLVTNTHLEELTFNFPNEMKIPDNIRTLIFNFLNDNTTLKKLKIRGVDLGSHFQEYKELSTVRHNPCQVKFNFVKSEEIQSYTIEV
jgi:hypothetical protein